MELLEWLKTQFAGQELLLGMIGVSIVTSMAVFMRDVPVKLWRLFLRQFTIKLTVQNDTGAFYWFRVWLSKHPKVKKFRRFRLVADSSDDDEGRGYYVAPGDGLHWFWHKGKLVWTEYILNADQSKGKDVNEQYDISCFGRKRDFLLNLISEANTFDDNSVKIHTWNDYWRQAVRRFPRDLNTVFMDQGQKEALVQDVERFLRSAKWYKDRGIPYRRGYLLTGPPGTGKTSLVFALASYLGFSVHFLNLASVHGDDSLSMAFSSVRKDSILLLEDVDAAEVSRQKTDEDDVGCVSLSGLLNTIDGVASQEGRIVVMTTNHPDRLDTALKRPGRVDYHIPLEPLRAVELQSMFDHFYPFSGISLRDVEGITAAEAQRFFLENPDDALTASCCLAGASPERKVQLLESDEKTLQSSLAS